VPGYKVEVRDTVGAGDAFAAAFLHGYHLGWSTMRTARFANAAGAIVASRAGATPSWSTQECLDIIPGTPSSSPKVGMMENQAGRSL
jgi:sugar/nucleoside kinase (ribokinase family)